MPNSPRKYCSVVAVAIFALGLAATPLQADPSVRCRIAVPAEVRLLTGASREFSLGFVPAEGFSVSSAGPLRLSLSPPLDSGLAFKRSELRRRHATDPSSGAPRFLLAVAGTVAGTYAVRASARFWLCKAALCRSEVLEARVSVVVSDLEATPNEGQDIE